MRAPPACPRCFAHAAPSFDAVCAAAEQDGVAAAKLLAQFSRELTLFEFQLARAATVCGANEREQESYAEAQAQLVRSISQAQADIQSLKGELEGARLERRQKEEYEVLRKQCMVHPSRSHTLASIAAVKSEIVALEQESEAAAARVEERKAQFSRLLNTIDELAAEWNAS